MNARSPARRTLPLEPDAHRIARSLQVAIKVLLVAFAVATVVCFLFLPEITYLAAIPIPILYLVLLVVNLYERGSRASVLRRPGQEEIETDEMKADEEMAGIAMFLKIGGTLAVAALLVAASLFEWQMVGIVAAFFFVYSLLLGLPYWVAAIQEAEDDEHEKVRKQRSPGPEGEGS